MKIRTGITGNITGNITGTFIAICSDPLRPNMRDAIPYVLVVGSSGGWRIQDLVPLGGGGHLELTELGLDLLDREVLRRLHLGQGEPALVGEARVLGAGFEHAQHEVARPALLGRNAPARVQHGYVGGVAEPVRTGWEGRGILWGGGGVHVQGGVAHRWPSIIMIEEM